MTQKKLIAIAYTRVSTDGQVNEGVSLDAQRERIVMYCKAHGLELIDVFSDGGISGKCVENRPALKKALDMACRKKAAIVVYSLSRMSRSTRDAIDICERLDRAGADLISLSENIDTTSAAGKMIFRMLAVLAEFERDLISERTTTALQHLKRQGKRISRYLPYGFALDGDGESLVPIAAEQETVATMRQARAQGSTLQAIAEKLNAEHVPSKRGTVWRAGTVHAVLAAAQ